MPVQNDSIIDCIKYTNPRRNKICSHLFSIIPGKESSQGTGDKVENKVTNRQAKTSTVK